MNTPSHVAASLLLGRRDERWPNVVALAFGAVLPDLPMFGFYGYQKWNQRSENDIWGTLYFEEHWQLFFDWFNSIPLSILLMIICWRLGFRWGLLLSASALLHMVCDLPVHHDDGHRHFLPFSNFRFESPVSYWDPKHFGWIFAPLELIFAITTCGWTIAKSKSRSLKVAAATTLACLAMGITLAITVWTLSTS